MKGIIIKIIVLNIVFLLFLDSLHAVNFESLAKTTLEESPIIKKTSLQTKISEEEINIAKSGYYPNIRLSGNVEYSKKFNNNNNPSYVGDDSLTQYTAYQGSGNIILAQELFSFGKTSFGVDAAKAKFNVTKYQEINQKKQTLLQLLDYYYKARIQQIKKQVQLKLQNYNLQIYNITKRLHESSLASKILVEDYAKNLAENLSDLEKTDELLKNYIYEINYISGASISSSDKLESIVNDKKPIKYLPFEQSEYYKKAKNTILQKESQYKQVLTTYFPSFSLYGKYDFYGYDKDSFSSSIDDLTKNGYRVGLSFSWLLFDGFSRESNKAIGLLEIEQAKLDMELAKQEYERNILKLKQNKKSTEEMLKHLAKSTISSQKIEDMNDQLFQNGEINKIKELQSKISNLNSNFKKLEAKETLDKNYQELQIIMSENLDLFKTQDNIKKNKNTKLEKTLIYQDNVDNGADNDFKCNKNNKLILRDKIQCDDMPLGTSGVTDICKIKIQNFLNKYNSSYFYEVIPILDNEHFATLKKLENTKKVSKKEIKRLNRLSNIGLGKDRALIGGELIKTKFGDLAKISYSVNSIKLTEKRGFVIQVYALGN